MIVYEMICAIDRDMTSLHTWGTYPVFLSPPLSAHIHLTNFRSSRINIRHFKNTTQRLSLEDMFRILHYPSSVQGCFSLGARGCFFREIEREIRRLCPSASLRISLSLSLSLSLSISRKNNGSSSV